MSKEIFSKLVLDKNEQGRAHRWLFCYLKFEFQHAMKLENVVSRESNEDLGCKFTFGYWKGLFFLSASAIVRLEFGA